MVSLATSYSQTCFLFDSRTAFNERPLYTARIIGVLGFKYCTTAREQTSRRSTSAFEPLSSQPVWYGLRCATVERPPSAPVPWSRNCGDGT
jgi:hypothetical protein